MIRPKKPRRKIGRISLLCSLENLCGVNIMRMKNMMQATRSRVIVRLIGDSSSSPILMSGKANAHSMIASPIIRKKCFSAKIWFSLVGLAILY